MDITTLFIYISISGICIFMMSIHVYVKHGRSIRGSRFWLAAIFTISSASILFGLSPLLPRGIAIYVSNSLMLLCPVLMSLSFRRLYHRSLGFPIVLYILSFLIFNLVAHTQEINGRILLFSILFGFLWLDSAFLVLRGEHRKSDGLLGGAFLFVAICSFARIGGTVLYERDLNSLIDGGPVQQAYIIAMGLALLFFLGGYILMLSSRYLDRIVLNEATLHAAIDDSPYGMVMTSPSGEVVSGNATFERITGYALPEIQKAGLSILKPSQSGKPFPEEIRSALLEGRIWRAEVQSTRKDGSHFWEETVWNSIRKENGEVTGFFGVISDISEKRQLEDFKNEIEHLMRHDLKTPFNAIIYLPEIIHAEGELSKEQREYLNLIRENGHNMLEQIDSSLELYKIEQRTYRPLHESADLRALLSMLRKTCLPLAGSQGIIIKCRYTLPGGATSDAPISISTDLPLFKRLISNLLKNAIEASPKDGTIDVHILLQGGGYSLSIHNAGAIPLEARRRFFSKFNTADKFGGTGLGAYSAKMIADCLGYGLSFTTDDKTGTTLTIDIPAAESEAKSGVTSGEASA